MAAKETETSQPDEDLTVHRTSEIPLANNLDKQLSEVTDTDTAIANENECTGDASTEGPGSSPEDSSILKSSNDIPPVAGEGQGDGQQEESPNKHEEVQLKTTEEAQPDGPVPIKEESENTLSVGSDETTENIVQDNEENMESQGQGQEPLSQETPTAEQTDPEKNVETIGPTPQIDTTSLSEDPPNVKGDKRIMIWIAVAFVAVAVIIQPLLRPEDAPQKTDRRQIDIFQEELNKMKIQFPSQREELWKRSRIHLQRHFLVAQPTEPISIILTAGVRAEATLHCLAQSIASALSSALNVSALYVDGASKSGQDSDKVKSDIDGQLQKAFEGEKPIAVIHRFEELPPASTLIFYRYCDHENAAFKKVFLIFTVLLEEEEEIQAKIHLSEVEEMVTDHLQKKFLSHGQPTAFDKMDIDKYGGLWSRISHLILPVATEKRIEKTGQC